MRCLHVALVIGMGWASVSLRADDPLPSAAQAEAVQNQMRKVIEQADQSMVALVISHNRNYPEQFRGVDPSAGRLGAYIPRNGNFQQAERDKLDLSDVRNIPDHNFGSGVIVDKRGLILTNYHLIENATKVYVRLPGGKGSYADIRAADSRSDLAVLQLITRPDEDLRPLPMAEVQLQDDSLGRKANVFRGMWVVSLGHPFAAGFADGLPSASWGIVSNVRRRIIGYGNEDQRIGSLYQFSSLIQTDARLNLGCSGGALVNLKGEMIGLTSSIAAITGSESSGGFALPMTPHIRKIVDRLIEGREVDYGFLGVLPGGMSSDPARPGLIIRNVSLNTPAAAAGLSQGDSIVEIDGVPVSEPDDLYFRIGAAPAGVKIALKVARPGGATRVTSVTLAKLQNPHPFIATVPPPSIHGLKVEYSSLLSQQFPLAGRISGIAHVGVIIRELEPGSLAEAEFKRLGGNDPSRWMITFVNGNSVPTPEDFHKVVEAARGPIRLTVVNPTDPRDSGRTVILPERDRQ